MNAGGSDTVVGTARRAAVIAFYEDEVAGTRTRWLMDSINGYVIGEYLLSNGIRDPDTPRVVIRLSELSNLKGLALGMPSGGAGVSDDEGELRIREMPICVGGVTKYFKLLCTASYDESVG